MRDRPETGTLLMDASRGGALTASRIGRRRTEDNREGAEDSHIAGILKQP